MTNGIFYHKADSIYDDEPASKYHFPNQYLTRVQKTIGDWIAYYGPLPGRAGRYYTAIARVTDVISDPKSERHHYALLEDYLDFDAPLEYSRQGGYEKKLFKEDGKPNGGYAVQAVRHITTDEFAALIRDGFSEEDEWPDRIDPVAEPQPLGHFSEIAQEPLLGIPVYRPLIETVVNRPFRDRKFKKHIRVLYDRTCAFTGLRLINGGGRPEVEACHIIPVEDGGNDSVQNGIALSGTVHWMFDRGLLSLSDDYDILASRHLNYDVTHLLHRDMKARVPENPLHRPHPHYLQWHRENKFKS